MRSLKVAAVDDERGVLLLLKSILSEMDGIQLAGVSENAAAAIELVKNQKPDLALLDIELPEELLAQFQFLRPTGGFRLPVAQGGGDGILHFMENVLVVVVPSVYDTYDDYNLTAIISTKNVVFTGVTATQQLLERHGLDTQALRDRGFRGELNVVYIAEEGLLMAQFAAYVVWLQTLALLALIVAFTVAAAISSLITALLQAKRDFPLRVAGWSWVQILQSRVAKELLVGIGLVGIVLLLQRPDAIVAVLMTAALGLLVVPLSHLFAVRWCFDGVSRRRI